MLLDSFMQEATEYPSKVVAVASADNEEVIEAVVKALEGKLATFLLYGQKEKINSFLSGKKLASTYMNNIQVVDAESVDDAAKFAVQAVNEGKADILMKGMVSTSIILKEVLNKDYGLRDGRLLSHIAVFQIQNFERLIFVTDAAMNIVPDLQQKVEIINNSVRFVRKLGIDNPKVAVISSVETVNPNMSATVDGALLSKMNTRGQIKNCIVDGPLALDNAISPQAAKLKGIEGEVAGKADIIMVPTVDVGNVLYKSLVYFSKAKVGAVILGAKVPIVLTSRSDSTESKLYSLALAVRSVR
ncbi:phosphate butyryltransferase [Anaerobacillus alkalilacustris]|uniref:Phosphate butyryltransferase n=1 Tax=Anaerobacillus alkalilacustris TaxID=393763 RepID=A0A1S2LX57_9BACI|nr:phosphate butyryltransferase [Anaerobacillus alkalilacustris]OIJ16894.1 phosphate butyryltransferase [Anaerobacillus alkalilacustris]